MVEYLGCLLDEDMLGETKARMVLKKVNGKKKFLYGQSGYLLYPLKRILCNTLIPPLYDFSCCSWQISPNIRTSRSTESFVVPFYKKEIARKSISYLGSKI